MKLRSMQAEVLNWEMVDFETFDGETISIVGDVLVFKSYASICAVYYPEADMLYLLPRFDYSPTTCRQLCAFLADFCHYPDNVSILDVRAWADDEGEDSVLKVARYCDARNSYKFNTY